MTFNKSFKQKLTNSTESDFDGLALDLFYHQSEYNDLYKRYIEQLGVKRKNVKKINEIPFLPISFFKNNTIKTKEWDSEKIFESSGTTGSETSKHHVKDLLFYQEHARSIFENVYGNPIEYHIMALLPSYLERDTSSLVFMVDNLIKCSDSKYSGFYLNNFDSLISDLSKAKKSKRKIMLIGVSFALLDLAEQYNIDLQDSIIIETGGMKGRRKEIIRQELHDQLKAAFNVDQIHSEYGMTELMSQAYAVKDGLFKSNKKLKVLLRDLNDPFDLSKKNKQGGINVIDLGNFSTCAFLETQDIGRITNNGFEVLGRFDNSEIRGCNLMI